MPVAAGGDGTVGMVAAGLVQCGMPRPSISIMPLGTANIVAIEVGLASPRDCFRALVDGHPFPFDLIHTSHPDVPVSLVGISAGGEGRFIRHYARWRRWGRALAVMAAIPGTFRSRGSTILEMDGQEVLGLADAAFSAGLYNTPSYVGGLVMHPEADPSDGLAEAAVYHTRTSYLRALAAGARGGAGRPLRGVTRRRWRTARIASTGPLQIDGEPIAPGEVSAWLEPSGLSLLVPSG